MSLNKAPWWLQQGLPKVCGNALCSSAQKSHSGPNKYLKGIDNFALFSPSFTEQSFVRMFYLTSQMRFIQKDDRKVSLGWYSYWACKFLLLLLF